MTTAADTLVWHKVAEVDELADGRVKTVVAGHKSSIPEPRIGSGTGRVRRWGRTARICAATRSGTVASIAVPSMTAPRLAKLAIEQRTLRVLPNMSSTMPRRSPL